MTPRRMPSTARLLALASALLAVACPAAAAPASAVASSTAASHTPSCSHQIKFISARGSDSPQSAGPMALVADQVIQNLPAYKPTLLQVVYPATITDPPYRDSVDAGAAAAQALVRRAVDRCPDVDLVLLGYSQGAQVVLDAAFGSIANWNTTQPLAKRYQDRIQAVVVMGDPSHYQPQTFVVGTANASGVLPRTNNYECAPLTSRVQSFCDSGDPYCSGGDNVTVHDTYLDRYAGDAYEFIVDRLAKAGKTGSY